VGVGRKRSLEHRFRPQGVGHDRPVRGKPSHDCTSVLRYVGDAGRLPTPRLVVSGYMSAAPGTHFKRHRPHISRAAKSHSFKYD
jgi:hypothetical protein